MRHVTGLWRQVTIIICVKWWTKITSEPVATFILPEKFRISTLQERYCFSLVPHSYKHPEVAARAEHRSCYSAFVTCVFITWSHSGENCAPGCGALVAVCKHRGWNAAHLGGTYQPPQHCPCWIPPCATCQSVYLPEATLQLENPSWFHRIR